MTDAERADLLEGCRLLGVAASEALEILDRAAASPAPPGPASAGLVPGDRVVLTGEMSLPREKIEALAAAAGLRATRSVSARTALLVTADPYSQSGKSRQARDLGVRMVADQVFLHMLEQMQPVTA